VCHAGTEQRGALEHDHHRRRRACGRPHPLDSWWRPPSRADEHGGICRGADNRAHQLIPQLLYSDESLVENSELVVDEFDCGCR
jgi:hypothetical protein